MDSIKRKIDKALKFTLTNVALKELKDIMSNFVCMDCISIHVFSQSCVTMT